MSFNGSVRSGRSGRSSSRHGRV
jgi:hypothetical protein